MAVCTVLLNRPLKPSAVTIAAVLSVDDSADGGHGLLLFNTLNDGHGSDLFRAGVHTGVEIVNKDNNRIPAADIGPGQLIELTYGGLVQTTYPASYMDVYKVKVLGQAAADLYALALRRQTEFESEFGMV